VFLCHKKRPGGNPAWDVCIAGRLLTWGGLCVVWGKTYGNGREMFTTGTPEPPLWSGHDAVALLVMAGFSTRCNEQVDECRSEIQDECDLDWRPVIVVLDVFVLVSGVVVEQHASHVPRLFA